MATLQITDLHVSVETEDGPKEILKGVTLTIRSGETHAIMGPNGSGKSTLVKLLAGQQKPTRGTVRFAGRPVGDWAGRAFARKVAYLPQFTPAADGMTVRELVALGRYPWHGALGRFGPRDHAAVDAALAECGVEGFADRLVDTLSGGERNRLLLAKLFAQPANLLVMDEPTNDLDVETLQALEAALEDFAGCAVIISHDRFFLDRLCTHILAFEGDAHVEWFEGNFEAYEEDKVRRLGPDSIEPKRVKYKKFTR